MFGDKRILAIFFIFTIYGDLSGSHRMFFRELKGIYRYIFFYFGAKWELWNPLKIKSCLSWEVKISNAYLPDVNICPQMR